MPQTDAINRWRRIKYVTHQVQPLLALQINHPFAAADRAWQGVSGQAIHSAEARISRPWQRSRFSNEPE